MSLILTFPTVEGIEVYEEARTVSVVFKGGYWTLYLSLDQIDEIAKAIRKKTKKEEDEEK